MVKKMRVRFTLTASLILLVVLTVIGVVINVMNYYNFLASTEKTMSVIAANNGPLAEPDEGMSRVNTGSDRSVRVYFKDFVDALGPELIGKKLYDKYGTWPMYSKFYDYTGPLFFHLHLDFESAARVGRIGKPEAYYYPPQYNNYPGKFPHTYFGFDPDTTKEQVRERLLKYAALKLSEDDLLFGRPWSKKKTGGKA